MTRDVQVLHQHLKTLDYYFVCFPCFRRGELEKKDVAVDLYLLNKIYQHQNYPGVIGQNKYDFRNQQEKLPQKQAFIVQILTDPPKMSKKMLFYEKMT